MMNGILLLQWWARWCIVSQPKHNQDHSANSTHKKMSNPETELQNSGLRKKVPNYFHPSTAHVWNPILFGNLGSLEKFPKTKSTCLSTQDPVLENKSPCSSNSKPTLKYMFYSLIHISRKLPTCLSIPPVQALTFSLPVSALHAMKLARRRNFPLDMTCILPAWNLGFRDILLNRFRHVV